MTIPSDKISFSKINTELGRQSTAAFDIDDADGRKLAAAGNTGQNLTTRTPIKLSTFRDHARAKVTILADQHNVNVNALITGVEAHYSAGKTYGTLVVDTQVSIGSTTTADPAMIVGDFISGDIVEIVNNGVIEGAGGAGGDGTGSFTSNPGLPGGNALSVTYASFITNNGYIWGGGGGGGSGSSGGLYHGGFSQYVEYFAGGAGGGGAGYDAGAGGVNGVPGSAGNKTQGGQGGGNGGRGARSGGAGGNPGNPGANSVARGGAPGYYLVGKVFVNNGDGISGGSVTGPVS